MSIDSNFHTGIRDNSFHTGITAEIATFHFVADGKRPLWKKMMELQKEKKRLGMMNVVLFLWFLGSTVHGNTVYMVTFPSQVDTTGDHYTIHIIGKPGKTVTIETPYHTPGGSVLSLGVTGHYEEAVSRTLYYLEMDLFDLQTKGVRISSDDDFTVSIIYGENVNSASAGAYSAIPVPVLEDPSFIIVTYDQTGSSFVYFAIASSEDNVTVSIEVKTVDRVKYRNINYFDGDTLEVTLQKLQVLQLASKRDLTGTVVRSNGPITVFAGIVCAAIPLGETTCDNILEQLPSVDLWGYRYLAAPLLGRTSGNVLRAVAAYNNTTIQRASDGKYFSLQSGDVLEWEMDSQGDEIRGTDPILVVQFSKSSSVDNSGGSAMMVLRAVEYYSPKFYIVAAEEFDTYVNILIQTEDNSMLLLDGNNLTFTSEVFLGGAGVLFRFAVSGGLHVIQSTNLSAVFDVVVHGYREGQGISYQALGPIHVQTADTTTTSVTAAYSVTETDSLAASSFSSAASSMAISSSTSVTDSGTVSVTYTSAADVSSFVGVQPERSHDTGRTITMDTSTTSSSSVYFSSAARSLTTSSSSPSSVSAASDLLSSAILDTTTTADSLSVTLSASVNTESGATPIGSTVISSTFSVSTDESLEFSPTVPIITVPSSSTPPAPTDGTAPETTQGPDSSSLSSPSNPFLDVSYSPDNAQSLWFSSQSSTLDNLSHFVTSSGATYETELVTSLDAGSISPSSVSSETGPSTTHTAQVIPTTEGIEPTKRSQHRRCHCGRTVLTSLNVTSMEFQQMLMAKKKNLTLSHQRLSSYIRSKTSAQDHRQTAQNVGYVGVALLSTVAALLFCGDVVTLFKRLF